MATDPTPIPSASPLMRLSIFRVWFGPDKRINRREFWLMGFIPLLCVNIAIGVVDTVLGATGLLITGAIATTVVSFLVAAKRWHDMNKSGWNSLAFFIPLLGYVVFIWLGFVKGNPYPNDYGPIPGTVVPITSAPPSEQMP